jgi:hypothetical protein
MITSETLWPTARATFFAEGPLPFLRPSDLIREPACNLKRASALLKELLLSHFHFLFDNM